MAVRTGRPAPRRRARQHARARAAQGAAAAAAGAGPGVAVRPWRRGDRGELEALAALERACFPAGPWTAAELAMHCGAPRAVAVVAAVDGEAGLAAVDGAEDGAAAEGRGRLAAAGGVGGYCVGRISAPDRSQAGAEASAPPELAVLRLAVDPVLRRRGVGSRLVAAAVARAEADLGARPSVALELRKGNAAALALYRKLGFLVAGERAGLYSNGDAGVLLVQPASLDL